MERFLKRDEVYPLEEFAAIVGMTEVTLKSRARKGLVRGVALVGAGKYVVVMEEFIAGLIYLGDDDAS
jgi:hypothetical protein